MGLGRKIFVQRVLRHKHGLPRETVDAPTLEVFRATLDGILGSMT